MIVTLVGGFSSYSGNVFARNPVTGVYGPVCDDYWSIEDVSLNHRNLKNFFEWTEVHIMKSVGCTINILRSSIDDHYK